MTDLYTLQRLMRAHRLTSLTISVVTVEAGPTFYVRARRFGSTDEYEGVETMLESAVEKCLNAASKE